MGIPKTRNELFSYSDYLSWNDTKRWEIIDGIAYDMTPAPGTEHQRISMRLSVAIGKYLEGKLCSVFSAPFDVRLAEKNNTDEETINVVQPDILVICDPSKIDERGVKGAPEWIIEITSPSTLKHDFGTKLLLYQQFGVPEYWIIDPLAKNISVFTLNLAGKYSPGKTFQGEDFLTVGFFPDFKLIAKEIFTY